MLHGGWGTRSDPDNPVCARVKIVFPWPIVEAVERRHLISLTGMTSATSPHRLASDEAHVRSGPSRPQLSRRLSPGGPQGACVHGG